MPRWFDLEYLVVEELKQREEEGLETEGMRDRFERVRSSDAGLLELYNEISEDKRMRADYPYDEPSDWEGIAAALPGPLTMGKPDWTEAEWRDKFLGAWQGRCAGCALGIPLEIDCFKDGSGGRPGWLNVKLWFEGADAWPIAGYTPGQSRAEEQFGLALVQNEWSLAAQRERIAYMPTDDDIRYTILGLLLLEEKGAGFQPWDVGEMWHKHLTYSQVYSAEGRAYLNYAHELQATRESHAKLWDSAQERVRTYMNPYREWIGAQIRADGLAYGAAGNPALAARLA